MARIPTNSGVVQPGAPAFLVRASVMLLLTETCGRRPTRKRGEEVVRRSHRSASMPVAATMFAANVVVPR
jgi:hypothetical protein